MARNHTYDQLAVGDTASMRRVVSASDLLVFAHASGNLNPLHLPATRTGSVEGAVAPSMWVGSLFSAVMGNVLPGVGTLYKSQALTFHGRAHVGDTLTASVTVREKLAGNLVAMDCRLEDQAGALVAIGVAEVFAPEESVETPDRELPELMLSRRERFNALIEACAAEPSLATAVVAPEDESSLMGALLARDRGLIEPVLIGAERRIRQVAAEHGGDLAGLTIEDVADHKSAAARAVQMVHAGTVGAIMKGKVHSHELLGAVTRSKGGLRTSRRISHVFVIEAPGLDHLLLVSDAAINIAPDLEAKVDITQNAIDMAIALGIEQPRVGILSAVETVNPKIPSTLDAAILSKMADRGQITGGLVDGPLAMDNAIDIDAARTKGVVSLVAGRADVLITPNLESGNLLAKELAFIGHAECAGLVVGAQCPIILTSRADDEESRMASCALAQAYRYWQQHGTAIVARRPAEAAA